jgi:GTP-dependent dephospho-CoA kinase
MYVLPEDLKDTMKGYIGQLVDEQRLLKLLKKEKSIVTVGDKVTYTVLKHGFTPLLCIVDFILERKPYPAEMKTLIQGFGRVHLKIKNPPGTITDELWDAIEKVYQNPQNCPVCIEVDGEEDLASLAAIYLAPGGVTVIYGLPNKGVVVVKATEAHKQKVKEVLDKM